MNIKELCKKAKNDPKKLNYDEMIYMAQYFGARIVNKRGARRNIHYPADSPYPAMQLHEPHKSSPDVGILYKKKFVNLFADEIDREVQSDKERD